MMNKRFAGLCLLALGAVALAPSVSRAGGSNYVTTKFVTPSNGVVTYYPATNTFSPSSIVVGGGYVYGDMGFFGTSCYKHDGGAGTPPGVQYFYSGGSQEITTKELCNINAGVDDLPSPIPATQIFTVPSGITCNGGVASVPSFTGTVNIKVAGYAQPMYSGDYGGGASSITLTASVSCPAVPHCAAGDTTNNYRGTMVCCPAGTTYDGAGNCATACPPYSSWDRYSASCLCSGTNVAPVNGVCGCPGNQIRTNGTCGCGGASTASLSNNVCTCPAGLTFQVEGTSANCECPSGTVINGCSNKCEAPHTCPKAANGAGQVWNCSTNKCVPIQQMPGH